MTSPTSSPSVVLPELVQVRWFGIGYIAGTAVATILCITVFSHA